MITGLFKKILNNLHLLGHAYFGVLVIFSILFFKERLFSDSAYYLIQLINTGYFAIEHGRFISVLPQLLPVGAILAHCNLQQVVLAFSVGDVLYYYAIFLVLLYALRDKAAAVGLLLTFCFSVLHIFVCPVTELLQGVALLILYNAMLKQQLYRHKWLFVLMLAMMVTIVFSHPLTFIVAVGFLVHYIVAHRDKADKWFFLQAGVLVLAVIVKAMLLDDYDGGKISYHLDYHNRAYMQVRSLTYMRLFVPFFIQSYTIPLLLMFLTLGQYAGKKEYKKASVYLLCCAGFLVLIVGTHYCPFLSDYSERMYLPFVPLAVVPFAYDVLYTSSEKRQRYFSIALVICIAARVLMLYNFVQPYKLRTAQLERILEAVHAERPATFVWDERNNTKSYNEVGWSLPCETAILSTLLDKEHTKLIVSAQFLTGRTFDRIPYIFRRDSIVNNKHLNPRYFSFSAVPNNIPLSAIGRVDTSGTFMRNISLDLNNVPRVLKPAADVYVQVTLKNTNERPLYSGIDQQQPIYLGYHWYNANTEPVVWEGIRTPLEIDIYREFTQDINVRTPDKRGIYTLVVDVVQGNTWFNSNAVAEITIK